MSDSDVVVEAVAVPASGAATGGEGTTVPEATACAAARAASSARTVGVVLKNLAVLMLLLDDDEEEEEEPLFDADGEDTHATETRRDAEAHKSRTSSTEALLEKCCIEIIVISIYFFCVNKLFCCRRIDTLNVVYLEWLEI